MSAYDNNDFNDLSQVSSQLKQKAHSATNGVKRATNTTKQITNQAKKVHAKLNAKRKAKKSKKAVKETARAARRVSSLFIKVIGAIGSALGSVAIFALIACCLIAIIVSSVAAAISTAQQNEANHSQEGSDGFLADGTNYADRLVALAHEQKGNRGEKYWREMNCSPGAWCAMYAGWLLREGANIDLEEYGWAANVGVWCDAFISKGLFHQTGGSYIPSVGDVMFKGTMNYRTHVGIVIGIDTRSGTITTSEGNATSGSYDQTVVTEKQYPINSSDIAGYGHVSIAAIDSEFTPRLSEPARSSNYYYSNENPFQEAGYGILANGGNCTAYAWGRAYEILGTKPALSVRSARYWYPDNKQSNSYSYGREPKLGAILCLSDNGNGAGGHVAVVEKINSDGSIVTSESGWNSYIFKTVTRYPSDGYRLGGNYTFQGFIYIYDGSVSYEDISGLTTEQAKAYSYFKSKGLNRAACCAIMANIMMECSFEPYWFTRQCDDVETPSLKAGGICMWTNWGSSWGAKNFDRFKRDCPSWQEGIDGQLVYLYNTLVKNDKEYLPLEQKYAYQASGIWTMLKNTANTKSGAQRAALSFCNMYENPSPGSEGRRQGFAAQFWDAVAKAGK